MTWVGFNPLMQPHPTTTFLLWLLGAVAAFAISVTCLMTAANGKINAFALVPFVWTIALSAGALRCFPREWVLLLAARVLPTHRALATSPLELTHNQGAQVHLS